MQNPDSAKDQIARSIRRLDERRLNFRKFSYEKYEFQVLSEWISMDEAKSGKSAARDGYEHILRGIRNRAFDILLVDDLSRLTRTLGNLIQLYDLLNFHQVELYSVCDGLSSADPNSKTNFQVTGLVNEMSNTGHGHRTKRGQEQKKFKGYSTGDICYGFGSRPTRTMRKGGRDVPSDYKIHIIAEEALVVNEIYDLYLSGRGFSGIAKTLNERKVPTSRRAQARTGKPYNWANTTIKTILINPKYIGIWTWGKGSTMENPETGQKKRFKRSEAEWVHHLGEHQCDPTLAIVPREKWEAVQQLLSSRKKTVASAKDQATGMRQVKTSGTNCEAILSSVLRCHVCGSILYQVSGKGGGYYGCFVHHKKDRTSCANNRLLPRRKVDQAVIEKLKEVISDPQHLEVAAASFNRLIKERLKDSPTRTSTLADRLTRIETEINNLIQFIMKSGASAPDSLRSTLTTKEAERGQVRHELEVLKQIGEDKVFVTPFSLKEKFQNLQVYLDKDADTAHRMMKLFFPEGLLAKPMEIEGRSRCNPSKNKWTISGVLIIDPDYRFSGLGYGGRCHRVVEPIVAVKTYAAQWFRPEIDLNELARLRWIEGRTLRQIALRLQGSKTTVIRALKRLESTPSLPHHGASRHPHSESDTEGDTPTIEQLVTDDSLDMRLADNFPMPSAAIVRW